MKKRRSYCRWCQLRTDPKRIHRMLTRHPERGWICRGCWGLARIAADPVLSAAWDEELTRLHALPVNGGKVIGANPTAESQSQFRQRAEDAWRGRDA